MIKYIQFQLVAVSLLCMLFFSCTYNKRLNNHFYLTTFDSDDNIVLAYKDSEDYMFTVVDEKIEAYLICRDVIFIVQHPISNHKVNDDITNYFIVDINIDYSDEKLKPQSVSLTQFMKKMQELCNGASLKKI
ncbi:hypothetical protein [Mucilaginibacter sp.]